MRIEITGDIVFDGIVTEFYDWFDIPYTSPNKIKKALNDSSKNEDLEIYINSPGGSVYAGFEIYNLLNEYKGKITVKIVGIAASAASFISQIPKAKVLMSPLSQMMIHRVSTSAEGNKNIMDFSSQYLQLTDDTVAQAYALKSGQKTETILKLMDSETFLSPQQALNLKLIDGIMDFTETTDAPPLYNCLNLNNNKLISNVTSCHSKSELQQLLSKNINEFLDQIPESQLQNNLNHEGDDETMDIKELKAKYPDLVDQIVNEEKQQITDSAVKAERERIQAINNLAGKGPQELLNEGIEQGLTAEQVALNILNKQAITNQTQMNNMQIDANNSGVNGVAVTPEPESDNKEDIDLLSSAGQEIMKGMV